MNNVLIEELNRLIRDKKYNEIVSSFTFDDRIEFVKNYEISASSYSNEIFKSIFTREEATLLYKNRIDEFDDVSIVYVISPLDDDEKEKYLSGVRETGSNEPIIKTFTSDEKKIEHLSEISEDFDKALLVSEFRLDEDKIKCLDYLVSIRYLKKIIESFISEENKLKELYRIIDDEDRLSIIEDFSSDELKLMALKYITNDEKKIEVISGFKSDELKQTLLSNISRITSATKEEIKKSPNDLYKSILIKQLKTDEEKLSMLGELDDEYYRLGIIKEFKSDELKLNAMNYIESQYVKVEVLQSLIYLPYETAIKYISTMTSDSLKAQTIHLLSTDMEKEKCLSLLTTDSAKSHIIRRFDEDLYKQRAIDKIEIEGYKADIILSINSKKIVFEETKKLANKSYKLFIAQRHSQNILSLQILALCDVPFSYLKRVIDNYQFFPNYIGECQSFIDTYSKALKLNPNHLTTFIAKFGLKTLKYIDNHNLKSLINLDEEMFNKYIDLLTSQDTKLNMDVVNDMINSYLSFKFKIENKDLYNTFPMLKSIIDDGREEELSKTIQFILESIKNFTTQEQSKKMTKIMNEIMNNYTNFDGFIKKLMQQDIDALNKLHEITNYYLMQCKNYYINCEMDKTLSSMKLKKIYNKNALIKHLVEKQITYKSLLEVVKLNKEKLDKDSRELVDDEELLRKVFEFKRNPNVQFENNAIRSRVIQNLVAFNGIFSRLYELDLLPSPNYGDIKFEYAPYDATNEEYITLVCNIDTQHLCNLMKDSDTYNSLVEVLKKYRFLGFGSIFDKKLESMGLIDGIEASYILINYYEVIKEYVDSLNINNLNIPIINMLKLISAYGESSIKYKKLFGEEDYLLIKSNPAPESASNILDEDRLRIASNYVKKLYQKEYVTIPSFDQDVTLENGKVINVVVGNNTNIINITYGERTGACMRIGGNAESLLNFCITNPNGFHIRFSNESNQLISRVSGFRNGNTVFLNELRYSKDKNYSDADLVNCCCKVSNMLIDLTKDSMYPIENVIISKSYALLADKERACLPLTVSNIKSGLGDFYSDVSSMNAVVLAKKDNTKELEIRLGPQNAEMYKPVRDKICRYSGSDIQQIQEHKLKLEIINQLLDDIDFCDVMCEEEEMSNLKSASFGEDWYVIIDNDCNIRKYVMPNSLNKTYAENEMNDEIKLMSKKIQSIDSARSHK